MILDVVHTYARKHKRSNPARVDDRRVRRRSEPGRDAAAAELLRLGR